MKRDILDQPILDNEELMQVLRQNGYNNIYEVKKGHIVVQQSPEVKVRISTIDHLEIKPLFPEIGNGVQLFSTVVLSILLVYLRVPFSLFIAIACGQLLSYFYFRPKALVLQKELNAILKKAPSS